MAEPSGEDQGKCLLNTEELVINQQGKQVFILP